MINDTLLVNIFDSVHIEGEGWDYIYRFNLATLLCMSHSRKCHISWGFFGFFLFNDLRWKVVVGIGELLTITVEPTFCYDIIYPYINQNFRPCTKPNFRPYREITVPPFDLHDLFYVTIVAMNIRVADVLFTWHLTTINRSTTFSCFLYISLFYYRFYT